MKIEKEKQPKTPKATKAAKVKKEKLPKMPKQKKVKEPKLPKEKTFNPAKQKIEKFGKTRSGGEKLKSVLVILLAIAVIAESAVIITGKKDSEPQTVKQEGQGQIVLNLDAGALTADISDEVGSVVKSVAADVTNKVKPYLDINAIAQKIVYSDTIVNMVMSMSYPLLFQVLTDLEMMDFAENVDLYPTPVQLAAHLAGDSYSCCDKDGVRKPLKDVLNAADKDWGYMENKVSVSDNSGNITETNLWNSIIWGVSDKTSFFKIMGDMSCGLRGVLEITLQGKNKLVNINLVEFLLKKDFANVNLDAAQIFNGTGKPGYDTVMLPLFSMLGLTPGDYPTSEAFCAYTELSDIWAAIFEAVFAAVNKAIANPLEVLPAMLVNFVYSVESGELVNSMKTLRMDADYHELASKFMGFEDGMIFNLGESLVGIIEGMGIKLSGNFNQLLDSLLQLILKNKSADMPDMDVNAILACGTKGQDSYGNVHYSADLDKTADYLVNYLVQDKTVKLLFDQTDFITPEEENAIIGAIGNSREGLIEFVNTVVEIVLARLKAKG